MAKVDVYESVTKRVIDMMEQGHIPWCKPWKALEGAFPVSHATGKAYNGINAMLLPVGEYATFKQIQKENGRVKKGEHGFPVVYWNFKKLVETDEETGEERTRTIPFLREYTVFNIEVQAENIAAKYLKAEGVPEAKFDPIESAERIISDFADRTGLTLVRDCVCDEAYYQPSRHLVNIPKLEQFDDASKYYSTIFHELGHSTMKALGRPMSGGFGSKNYAKEELVAEMTAGCILSMLGFETQASFTNSVAYIESWSKALKEDKTLFVTAANRADKAVALILNMGEGAEDEAV